MRSRQPLYERLQEPIGLVTVHHSMVDGQSDITPRPDHDAVFSILGHDDRTFLQLANAQDSRLGLVDDYGRCNKTSTDPVIGDSEGATAYVNGRQTAFTRARDQILESLGYLKEVTGLHVS
jgi:hypothetical protein